MGYTQTGAGPKRNSPTPGQLQHHCEPPRPSMPKSGYASQPMAYQADLSQPSPIAQPSQPVYQPGEPAPGATTGSPRLRPSLGAGQQQQQQQFSIQRRQAQQQQQLPRPAEPVRITLPYSGAPLLGPLKLEHDVPYATKVFHLSQQLFDTLNKSTSLNNQRFAASVPSAVHELQLKAYLVSQQQVAGASCKHSATNNYINNNNQQAHSGDSLLASSASKPARQCCWPDNLQVSINHQPVYIERNKTPAGLAGAPGAPSGATNVFALCQPGENIIELSGADCYCSYEFTLETIERPLLAAFVDTCLRKRLLATEPSVAKLRNLIGQEQALRAKGMVNPAPNSECLAIYSQEPTTTTPAAASQLLMRLKTSLKCPVSGVRMSTPARGTNCKHFQCFDLEPFLFANRDRSQWSCPVCSAPVQFNAIDIDQLMLSIVSEMAEILDTDEILFNELGHYQAYYPDTVTLASAATNYQPQAQAQTQTQIQHHQHQPAQDHLPARLASGQFSSSSQQQVPKSYQAQFVQQQHQQQHHHEPHQVARGAQAGSPHQARIVVGQQQQAQPVAVYPQQQQQQQMVPLEAASRMSPMSQPVRRPASSLASSPASGGGGASHLQPKKTYAGQFGQGERSSPQYAAATSGGGQFEVAPPSKLADELSPLAAMERTIIQHEQQMLMPNAVGGFEIAHSGQARTNKQPQQRQPSPVTAAVPTRHLAAAASPPRQQQQVQSGFVSTPATPPGSSLMSSSQACPELPATPSGNSIIVINNNISQPSQANVGHLATNSGLATSTITTTTPVSQHDQQPLSNGSASVGSIMSSSTMTPSGQSLGSVGMGGDSRCGTAPPPAATQVVIASGSQDEMLSLSSGGQSRHLIKEQQQHQTLKQQQVHQGHNQVGGSSLLAGSSRPLDSNELALALGQVDWKEQCETRGKSQHLANFLNEPLLSKTSAGEVGASGQQSHNQTASGVDGHTLSSPGHHLDQLDQLDRLDLVCSYLDTDSVNIDTGLPPDDSILDLFER